MLRLIVVKMNAFESELCCMSAKHTMNMQTQCEQVYQYENMMYSNHIACYEMCMTIKGKEVFSNLCHSQINHSFAELIFCYLWFFQFDFI